MDPGEMTNDEIRMTKGIRITNNEWRVNSAWSFFSSFGLRGSFGFRHSSFVIRQLAVFVAASPLTGCLTDDPHDNSSPARVVYPFTRRTNVVDDYHGVKVADPYRWLEDDNSPETRAWVEAQNKVTSGYLQQMPELPAIKARLTRLWNYERYGVPFKQGGRYFISKNDGLQNQSVLYTMTSLDAEPSVLLDPNKLSADGTVALKSFDITQDGNLMAYALSAAGSDWEDVHVRDVRLVENRPDLIKWGNFSGLSW